MRTKNKPSTPKMHATFGFTTSYSELVRSFGMPTKNCVGYNESEILNFGSSGSWVHFGNTNVCFKHAASAFDAESMRLKLARRRVAFTLKRDMKDPTKKMCNKHPSHVQDFDADLAMCPLANLLKEDNHED